MSRRTYIRRMNCGHDGCKEYGRWEYDTRKDYEAACRRQGNTPWYCTRHGRPKEVLHPVNDSTKTCVVTMEVKPYGHFWSTGSGYMHGPGFMAWAEDFPPGSEIHITATVKLP